MSPTFYRKWILGIPLGVVSIIAASLYVAAEGIWTDRTASLIIGGAVLFVLPVYILIVRQARSILKTEERPQSWGRVIGTVGRDALAAYGAVQIWLLL